MNELLDLPASLMEDWQRHLTISQSNIGLVKQQLKPDSASFKRLQLAEEAGAFLEGQLEKILFFIGQEKQSTPCKLSDLYKDGSRITLASENIQVNLSVAADLNYVSIGQGQLTFVINQLVRTFAKYVVDQEITVAISKSPADMSFEPATFVAANCTKITIEVLGKSEFKSQAAEKLHKTVFEERRFAANQEIKFDLGLLKEDDPYFQLDLLLINSLISKHNGNFCLSTNALGAIKGFYIYLPDVELAKDPSHSSQSVQTLPISVESTVIK